MKKLILLAASLFSLAAIAEPIGVSGARHLLERSGFGAPPALIAEYSRLDRNKAVDRLLNATGSGLQRPPPDIPYERPGRLKTLSDDERKVVQREHFRQGAEMRAWWAGEMLRAPTAQDALRERMTLFWHNHFVSSQQKVKSGTLMLRQNEILRRNALGNFSTMLHAVSKDPAMLIYLDGASNRKANPNENFAREVMELFTLGEGHYTEQDIKEAARAFTGWSFAPESGQFIWRPAIHDFNEKLVLGRRGNFDGDAVLDILLAQPATAQFVANKLWREFISPTPDPAEIRKIAAALRSAGYEIRPALRAIFLSDAFWSPLNRGSLTKAPVDLVIGTLRTLAVDVPEAMPIALSLRHLGQDLFAPPNVRGWPGGEAWINSTTLLARKQFIERLLRATEMENRNRVVDNAMQMHFDSTAWLANYRDFSAIQITLLAIPPVQAVDESATGLSLLRSLLLDPVFQLK
jgi:uncharacterized protein (DUF1800 family)